MSSPVEICNMALAMIGKPAINNLTEARPEAAACRVMYDPVRRMLLQASAWTFAKRRAALARLAENDFEARWPYAYARPADALSILRVMRRDYAPRQAEAWPRFEVREQRIYTTVDGAVADYVFDQTNAGQFSPLFVDALSMRMAERLARNLTRSERLAASMDEQARIALSRAVAADAAQEGQTYLYGSDTETINYTDARRTP